MPTVYVVFIATSPRAIINSTASHTTTYLSVYFFGAQLEANESVRFPILHVHLVYFCVIYYFSQSTYITVLCAPGCSETGGFCEQPLECQ